MKQTRFLSKRIVRHRNRAGVGLYYLFNDDRQHRDNVAPWEKYVREDDRYRDGYALLIIDPETSITKEGNETRRQDRVMALPSHLDTASLRLYCLNLSQKVLILGNGGIKTTKTYEEDAHLNRCVQTLQKIDIVIKQKEREQIVTIQGTNLIGPLSFTIDD